jgi:hypothetical protein
MCRDTAGFNMQFLHVLGWHVQQWPPKPAVAQHSSGAHIMIITQHAQLKPWCCKGTHEGVACVQTYGVSLSRIF